MTLHSAPWKRPVLSKLDDPPPCWQITDYSWTSLQQENHFIFSHVRGHRIQGYISSPWTQGLDEINTFKNYLQEIRNMSNFQIWKEIMGFNSNWHMLCFSPWDSMVCIANHCRNMHKTKKKFSGEETNRSTQACRFLRMQRSSFFALNYLSLKLL